MTLVSPSVVSVQGLWFLCGHIVAAGTCRCAAGCCKAKLPAHASIVQAMVTVITSRHYARGDSCLNRLPSTKYHTVQVGARPHM